MAATLEKPSLRFKRHYAVPVEKVLAAAVRVMDETLIRVGNKEYTRDNETYGLTTLRDKHVHIDGSRVTFEPLHPTEPRRVLEQGTRGGGVVDP